jgi:uncharacterized protein
MIRPDVALDVSIPEYAAGLSRRSGPLLAASAFCYIGADKGRRGDACMAMTMNGEVQLAAPREEVWAKLNDPDVLKACIPGCESLEKLSENEYQAVAVNKIGPVKARFKGRVALTDLDPPNGYRISGQGDGGVAGFAKGGATVKLTPNGEGTVLSYDVEAQIGGKLAQLGQRLVNGAAKKMADQFFEKFAAAVNPAQPG